MVGVALLPSLTKDCRDLRSGQLLRNYPDFHTEDITNVSQPVMS